MVRVFAFALVALAMTAFLSSAVALAGDKDTHDGKVVSIKGGKLTMETKGKEHSHEVTANAKITCDGKECKLSDLKAGTLIRVTVDANERATRIQAFLKETPPKE
jgi:hypothetical protein